MYDQVYTRVPFPPPSCLDSAMERQAIDEGFSFNPIYLFPENKEYYLAKDHKVKEWSYNSEIKEYEPYESKKK